MAMVFAVNEINLNTALLPNITLGYVIHDSCYMMPKTVQAALSYLEEVVYGDGPCFYQAVVGATSSTASVILASFLGIYFIPQVFIFCNLPLTCHSDT